MASKQKISYLRFLLLTLILTVALAEPCTAIRYKCTRVVDGDTINVVTSGNQVTVRLVGIDAPETSKRKHEPGQPFSETATKYLAGLLLNKAVEIKSYGYDRYGRTLGVVYINGTNANLEMVKAGLAEVYRGNSAPGFDSDLYWKAEELARKELGGMWIQKDKYISPSEWRKRY